MRDIRIEERITTRTKVIDRYLVDVSHEKRLTTDQEYEIACRVREGDPVALEILIRSNLRFVISAAKQYASGGIMLEELIAQGNIGLIDAAKSFDPSRGFKFISYAVWHIRKEILKYLNDLNRTVRLPLNVTIALRRIKAAETSLAVLLGREVTDHEISEELKRLGHDLPADRVNFLRKLKEKSIALESSNPDEEFSPIQWLESDDTATSALESSEKQKFFSILFSVLTPMEEEIVKKHLGIFNGDPLSFPIISTHYDRSGEWARGVYTRALKKMKQAAKKMKLTEELQSI